MFDFDKSISRAHTDSSKYDLRARFGHAEDVLPMWVADMDFKSPPCVIDAIVERAQHGIFGYSDGGESYRDAVLGWFREGFGFEPERDALITTAGVVQAVSIALRALTAPGDAVLIQEPVYYPFRHTAERNGRKIVSSALVYADGRYTVDLGDFERTIVESNVKLFILCSPHNPVGRVWDEAELRAMGDLCLKHGVKVISDEIHADFVYPGKRHRVFETVRPEYREITVTCTAPSKTFNLAGIPISNIFIADEALRQAFSDEAERSGRSAAGALAIAACRAAYAGGRPWLEALLAYLKGNVDTVREHLAAHVPGVRLVEPEGTYLVWLDCTGLGLDAESLDRFMAEKAKLWLDGGTMFGAAGAGFQRVNLACPRKAVEQAMTQLAAAVRAL